jgi:predicted kinase
MKKAYITVGISASGKTTWAHEFQKDSNANGETFVVISRDDVRWSMMKSKGITPSWANWKWKWEDEVTAIVNGYIREASVSSEIDGIIIADTNLDSDRLSSLKTELSALGFDTIVKVFDVEFDEAVRRDAARANGVGYSVIQRQYQKFISNYKDK